VCDKNGIRGDGKYCGNNDAQLGRIKFLTTRPRAASTVGLLFSKSIFLYRQSEAGNEKYYYELHARSGLGFVIRHQDDAFIVSTSS
jgi:hypothetical protein